MTLTDFLLARVAEDEREASVCLDQHRRGEGSSRRRWERVLAECDAKRRIVEQVTWGRTVRTPDGTFKGRYNMTEVREPNDMLEGETTLSILALPYADHPDYDEAWRP